MRSLLVIFFQLFFPTAELLFIFEQSLLGKEQKSPTLVLEVYCPAAFRSICAPTQLNQINGSLEDPNLQDCNSGGPGLESLESLILSHYLFPSAHRSGVETEMTIEGLFFVGGTISVLILDYLCDSPI